MQYRRPGDARGRAGTYLRLGDPDDGVTVRCDAAEVGVRRTHAAYVYFDGEGIPTRVPYAQLFSR